MYEMDEFEQKDLPLTDDLPLPAHDLNLGLGVGFGSSANDHDWCDGCRRLRQLAKFSNTFNKDFVDEHVAKRLLLWQKAFSVGTVQEIKKLKDDHSLNYSTLKQKIISTDLLIKKYRIKCDEFDVQTKKNTELAKKMEKMQRDCLTLESQLKTSLQDMEPLKKMKNLLEEDVKQKKAKIINLQDQLKASEIAQKQYETLGKASIEQKEKSEEEKNIHVKKIQSLENSNRRLETNLLKLKDENRALKADLSSQQKKHRNLENQLQKIMGKQESYFSILKKNDLCREKKETIFKTEPVPQMENIGDSSSSVVEETLQEVEVMSESSSSEEEMCPPFPDYPMYWSPLAPILSPLPPSPYIPSQILDSPEIELEGENKAVIETCRTEGIQLEEDKTMDESSRICKDKFSLPTVTGAEVCEALVSECKVEPNSRGDAPDNENIMKTEEQLRCSVEIDISSGNIDPDTKLTEKRDNKDTREPLDMNENWKYSDESDKGEAIQSLSDDDVILKTPPYVANVMTSDSTGNKSGEAEVNNTKCLPIKETSLISKIDVVPTLSEVVLKEETTDLADVDGISIPEEYEQNLGIDIKKLNQSTSSNSSVVPTSSEVVLEDETTDLADVDGIAIPEEYEQNFSIDKKKLNQSTSPTIEHTQNGVSLSKNNSVVESGNLHNVASPNKACDIKIDDSRLDGSGDSSSNVTSKPRLRSQGSLPALGQDNQNTEILLRRSSRVRRRNSVPLTHKGNKSTSGNKNRQSPSSGGSTLKHSGGSVLQNLSLGDCKMTSTLENTSFSSTKTNTNMIPCPKNNLQTKENISNDLIQKPLMDSLGDVKEKKNAQVVLDENSSKDNIPKISCQDESRNVTTSAFIRTKPVAIVHQTSMGFDPISPLKEISEISLPKPDNNQNVSIPKTDCDIPPASGNDVDKSHQHVLNSNVKTIPNVVNSAQSLSKLIPDLPEVDGDISKEISDMNVPTFGDNTKKKRNARKQSISKSASPFVPEIESDFSQASSPVPSPSTYFSVLPFTICQPISPLPPSPQMPDTLSEPYDVDDILIESPLLSVNNDTDENIKRMGLLENNETKLKPCSRRKNRRREPLVRQFSAVAPPDALIVKPRQTSTGTSIKAKPAEPGEVSASRSKKRPSVENTSSIPEKRLCTVDHMTQKTVTDYSLDGAVEREIEEELKAYLNGGLSVGDFIAKLFRDRHIGATILSVSKVIVYVLQSCDKDMLQILHERCTNNCACSPCLTDTEFKIIQFIKISSEDKNINFSYETILQPLWNSIFSTVLTPFLGKLSTCRMFTAVCLLKGDLEQARVFFYHVLNSRILSYPCIAATISGVWPNVLIKTFDACRMSNVFELIVSKALSADNQKHQKILLCMRTLCKWSEKVNISSEELLQNLLKTLLHIYNPVPDFTVQVTSFEICKSIELLCLMEGWTWANSQFLTRQANSICNKWLRKADECGLVKEYLLIMIRLIASVIQSAESPSVKEIKVLLRCFILPMLKVKSSWPEVQNCLIETAIELSPFSPVQVFYALNNLKLKTPLQFPFELRQKAKDAFNFLNACQGATFRFSCDFI